MYLFYLIYLIKTVEENEFYRRTIKEIHFKYVVQVLVFIPLWHYKNAFILFTYIQGFLELVNLLLLLILLEN